MIVILVATYFSFNSGSSISIFNSTAPAIPQSSTASAQQLKINDTTINVEIADTDSQRAQGLGGRASLPQNSGMLFIFSKPDIYKFWMKDMKFPLDFIWINNNTVVDLLPNIPNPPSNTPDNALPIYEPVTQVNEVLEVNAGFISSHSIRVGDKVELVSK